MKEKRKKMRPLTVFAVVLVSVMVLVTSSILVMTAIELVPSHHYTARGLLEWMSRSDGWSAFSGRETKGTFLGTYAYEDGDYYFDRYVPPLFGTNFVSCGLVWLTYDDPDWYAAAKQSRLNASANVRERSGFHEIEAHGFTFLCSDNIFRAARRSTKLIEYEAFAYNDETQTLIFLDLDASGKKQCEYMQLEQTDFPAFLAHYYGEWFDWEAGVGIHLPE